MNIYTEIRSRSCSSSWEKQAGAQDDCRGACCFQLSSTAWNYVHLSIVIGFLGFRAAILTTTHSTHLYSSLFSLMEVIIFCNIVGAVALTQSAFSSSSGLSRCSMELICIWYDCRDACELSWSPMVRAVLIRGLILSDQSRKCNSEENVKDTLKSWAGLLQLRWFSRS